jgi:hypothetical protein
MRLGTSPDVRHYLGSQQVQRIYYNGNIVYSLISEIQGSSSSNLQLNDLSGYLTQEDGFLFRVNYNNVELNNLDGLILQDDGSYIFIDK